MTVPRLGLLRIGRALVALPVDALAEVVPHPGRFAPLACAAEGLRGAVQVREMVVPVLDLRPRLGLPEADGDDALIVLVRERGRLLGLLAAEVRDILHAPALTPLAADRAAAGVATHCLPHGGEVVTVLDAAALMALPGVPSVEVARAPAGAALPADATPPLLLLRCGGRPLAIEADAVGATLPRSPLRDSALRHGHCLGVVDALGREVPVVDTLALLGFDRLPAAAAVPVLLLRYPDGGALGLAIDDVQDIVRRPAADVHPLPPLAARAGALLGGVLAATDTQPAHWLLDVAAWHADPLLANLARLATAATSASAAAARQPPYLVFRAAGDERAAPLAQVREIVPLPARIDPLPGAALSGALGLMTHRGAAVPLVALAGASPEPATARVLVVEQAGHRIGFVVDGLQSIEPARRRRPGGGARPPMVELGEAAGRLVVETDLAALAAGLCAPPAAGAAGVRPQGEVPRFGAAAAARVQPAG